MSKRTKKFVAIIFIVSLMISAVFFGNPNNLRREPVNVEQLYLNEYQGPIFSILTYIENFYFDKESIDYNKILDSTLRGIMSGLNDPFAWYFDARETQEHRIDERGEYGGLGITVRYDNDSKVIVIVSPMAGTPAERAGLMANDYIISVDGEKVSDLGYMESVDRMRGTPGEPVELEIFRQGWEEEKTITIYRELIETTTVKYNFIEEKDKKIGYLKITNFAEKTPDETFNILSKMSIEDLDGFILDLRNNPGGILKVAVETASMMQKTGRIASVKYYNNQTENLNVMPGKYFHFLDDIPMIILVNRGSASASEILTGSFKDNKLAVVVGQRTYGKAAVQRPFELSNGGEIWLPIGQYLTPNNTNIHLEGITPDFIIDNPIRELSTGEISTEEQERAKQATTDIISVDLENDNQLLKALELIFEEIGVK